MSQNIQEQLQQLERQIASALNLATSLRNSYRENLAELEKVNLITAKLLGIQRERDAIAQLLPNPTNSINQVIAEIKSMQSRVRDSVVELERLYYSED